MVRERGLLEAAVQYAALGYRVFPLAGKVPVMTMGENFSQASTDQALLHEWWGEQYPDCNIAILTGPDSGLLALDIDARSGGFSSLQQITAMHGELPATVSQRTGGGGKHFLFRYPSKDIKSRTAIAPGIDVKANAGYIVAPPSIHLETKQHYQWVDGASLFDCDLANCPSWLIDLAAKPARMLADNGNSRLVGIDAQLLHYGQRALEDECRNIESASNGSQETTVNQASFAIGQLVGAKAISFEHAYGEMFAAALKMSSFKQKDPWREVQLGAKIRRGLEDGMRSPRNIVGQKVPRTGRDQEQDLITAIQEINKTHAVVQLGSRTRILKQGTCPINGWPKVDFLAQDDVKLRFNKHRYLEEGRREGLGTIWLRHPERREYDQVVFNTKGAPPEHFNLWQGYPIKPAKSDKADRFLEHIQENMAGGNNELYNYTLGWMADAIQNPASKPGVALVLRGDQGVGKSFFADQFGSLFGAHYTTIHNPRHVFGDFNSSLHQMLLVFVDEVTWIGDDRSHGILKGLITAPTINIEKKGVDAAPVQNFSRFILASNSERVVPAGPCERRFFVLDVQDHHKQDNQYFADIAQDMDSGGREALMYFLQTYDLSGRDLRAFPKTAALQEQKRLSLEPFRRVWLDWLMRGSILTENWAIPIPTGAFCEVFREAALKMGHRSDLSETAIGQKLHKILPADPKSRSSLPGRPYVYIFPSLAECRNHFCLVTGIPIEWPADDNERNKTAA